jgi:hypothetical protein
LTSNRNGFRNRRQYKPEQAAVFSGLTIFLKKLVKGMLNESVKILLGTDTSFEAQTFTFPSISAHEELLKLVDAGLTPYHVMIRRY